MIGVLRRFFPKKEEVIVNAEEDVDLVFDILQNEPSTAFPRMMPRCDRYTNSPCPWSNTDVLSDVCIKCGTRFPGW